MLLVNIVVTVFAILFGFGAIAESNKSVQRVYAVLFTFLIIALIGVNT